MISWRRGVFAVLLGASACRVQVSVGDAPAAGGASAGASGAAGNSGTSGVTGAPGCVEPSGRLVNTSFEAGSGEVPDVWQLDAGAAGPRRVALSAHTGTYALAISNSGEQSSAASFRQKLALAPYTAYVLRGFMRAEGARDLGSPRFFAELSAEPYFLASVGPESAALASNDWQPFELDFVTGYDGNIEVSGRLNGAGTVYFDDVSVTCNTAVRRYESEHFILDLRPDQEQAAGVEAVHGVVERTERVISAVAQLTGQDPAPNGFRQAAFGPRWFEQLGWSAEEPGGAGYPFLWRATSSMFTAGWTRSDYVPESFVLAIAQNFASPAWSFELAGSPEAHDASAFVAYYAYRTLNLASVEPQTRIGADNRERFSSAYSTYWSKRRCARSDALAYRHVLLSDSVGFMPFEQAYRALGAATDLPTPWQRVKTFHEVLAYHAGRRLSGSDAEVAAGLALFSATEWEDVRRYYDRSLSADFPAPALVDTSVRELSLGRATWESAATDWAAPARNTLADGCPLATASASYAEGLWAHAASSYVFELGGAWQSFSADYGMAFGVSGGSARFEVLGDGRVLFSSEKVSDAQSRSLSLSIAGVQRLELRTETPPHDDGSVDETLAWSVWLSPTLSR